jgi:hypothetical protein
VDDGLTAQASIVGPPRFVPPVVAARQRRDLPRLPTRDQRAV